MMPAELRTAARRLPQVDGRRVRAFALLNRADGAERNGAELRRRAERIFNEPAKDGSLRLTVSAR